MEKDGDRRHRAMVDASADEGGAGGALLANEGQREEDNVTTRRWKGGVG